MSIVSRIKELRIKRGLTQEERAKQIGVTKGAVANYENEVSSPKIDLMYKLFDALDCDANYLHQDDMKKTTYKNSSTPEEFEKLVKPYRALDPHGQDMVLTVLNKEYDRCLELQDNSKITQLPDRSYLDADAAHERTDEEVTADMVQTDDNFMDNTSFWKK